MALAARPQSVHIGARIDLNVQGCKMMQAYMATAAKHLQTAKNLRATHDIAASTRRTNLAPRKITKLENWPIQVEKPNRRLGHPNCRTAETGIHRIGGLGIFFTQLFHTVTHSNKVQNVQSISKVCHPLTVFNSWRLHQISRTSLRFLGSGPKGFWPEQRKRFLRTRTKFGPEAFCQHVKRLRNALSKTRTIRRSTKPEFWLQLGM